MQEKDEEFDNFKSSEQCLCCEEQRDGYVCYHHILTRKSYPEHKYGRWNLAPVCLKHHNMFHSHGTSYMKKNFPRVSEWLDLNGWYINFLGKWWNENANQNGQ